MKITPSMLRPRETAPKDRPFLLTAICAGVAAGKRTVELVQWDEYEKAFFPTGAILDTGMSYEGDDAANYRRDLSWCESSSVVWHWIEEIDASALDEEPTA